MADPTPPPTPADTAARLAERQRLAGLTPSTGPLAASTAATVTPMTGKVTRTSPFPVDIDYSTKHGLHLHRIATATLHPTWTYTGDGKDLLRLLELIKDRARLCGWDNIITVDSKNLLKDYGAITVDQCTQARDRRIHISSTGTGTTRDDFDTSAAELMYHCLIASLSDKTHKKVLTKLQGIDYDGPLLLRTLIMDTFVTTLSSTFENKASLFTLNLKQYQYNVVKLHEDVANKLASLSAVGRAHDDNDLIINLFQAYETATNEDFLAHIKYLKSDYHTGKLTSAPALQYAVEEKYHDLSQNHSWKPKKDPGDVLALTAQIKSLADSLKGKDGHNGGGGKNESKDGSKSKWKYEKSLGTNGKLDKNDKTYHWCEGPGHGGTPMWTIHASGTCTNSPPKKGKAKPSEASSTTTGTSGPSDVIHALKAVLDQADPTSFNDDNNAQLQAILAVIQDL
jgi:hypothetical protein